jgi:hypothetical protein
MSFIVGDEIITNDIPIVVEPILKKLKDNTREKSKLLMKTIATSDKFMAYVIPEAGMVFFAEELKDEQKIFRFLVSNNGELYIDNKQRKGEMFCPLFDILETEIREITGREAETVSDDKEYKRYDKFMPKIIETVNQILTTKPDIFKH